MDLWPSSYAKQLKQFVSMRFFWNISFLTKQFSPNAALVNNNFLTIFLHQKQIHAVNRHKQILRSDLIHGTKWNGATDRHRTNAYVEGGRAANKFRGQIEREILSYIYYFVVANPIIPIRTYNCKACSL